MPVTLMLASAAITLALVFYTFGVFSERKSGHLSGAHVALFWCGLAFDTTGTTFMTAMAHESAGSASATHGITGAVAIVLMLVHALWATLTWLRRDGHREQTFHRFSTLVWLLWLIPYLSGVMVGVPFITLGDTASILVSAGIVVLLALVLNRPRSRRVVAG